MAGRYDKYKSNYAEDNSDEEDFYSEEEIPSTAHLSTSELRALAQSHLRAIEDEDTLDAAAQRQVQADLAKYTKTRTKTKTKSKRHGKSGQQHQQQQQQQYIARPLAVPSTNELNPALITSLPPSISTSTSPASPSTIPPTTNDRNTASSYPAETSTITNYSNDHIDTNPSKGPKLRSASDVLDRLRWDPSITLSEYTIGYLERFEGIKEMPADAWRRESTDEEFIPMHRIKWVKRRWVVGGEGERDSDNANVREEVVWDRERRVDKVFGSGVTGSVTRIGPATEEWEGVSSVDGGAPL